MKKRIISGLLVGTVVFGTVTGLAATLSVTSGQLGSGSATVSSCDSDGVTTSFTYNGGGGVTAVVVGGIQDGSLVAGSGACDGETVHVELLSSGGSVVSGGTGSATVTGDTVNDTNDTVTVTLSSAVAAVDVVQARVTITG